MLPDGWDEDEIAAEITDVLQELVNDGHLELASSHAVVSLAGRLLPLFEEVHGGETDIADIADFLLERDEVSELYIDGDELAAYFRPVFRRMRDGDDGGPKHHPELFGAMARAPADLQARAVYADWLQENGDPRGELMILQLAEAKPKLKKAERERLTQQQRNLLAKYRTHFYGDLTMSEDIDDRVRGDLVYGFFEDVRVSDEFNLKTLLTIESGRLLRRLTIESRGSNAISAVLATTRLPESLESLAVTDTQMGYGMSEPQALDLGAALRDRSSSRLELVNVSSPKILLTELSSGALATLESLLLQTHFLETDPAVFSIANLPNLTSLVLAVNDMSPAALSAIGAFLKAPPSKLREVTLTEVAPPGVGKALAHTLLTGAGASQLTRLDFTALQLDDEIGALLLSMPDTLAKVILVGNQFPATHPRLVERWPDCGVFAGGDDWDDDDGEDGEYDNADE